MLLLLFLVEAGALEVVYLLRLSPNTVGVIENFTNTFQLPRYLCRQTLLITFVLPSYPLELRTNCY